MPDTTTKATRFLVLLAMANYACGGADTEDVAIHLEVKNESARMMQCRAGYVFNLVEQPENMSAFMPVQPAATVAFTFYVPRGAFATVAAECQSGVYPQEPQYAIAWRITNELTEPIDCVAAYTETSELSEFNMVCAD